MEKKHFPLTSMDPDPFKEFKKWIALAESQNNMDVEAMTLATVSKEGVPSARMVLFKGLRDNGFLFYSNYESKKGKELETNPNASLVFYWPGIYRQIRIDGKVKRLTRLESEDYFRTRPRESQIAAWASEQSREVKSFKDLDKKFDTYNEKFEGQDVPCPPFWGGFRLEASEMEFWLGQKHRMHHRYLYTLTAPEKWTQKLLSP
jgi:pyridoxamine 5'-phosphate oxidase